MNRYSVIETKMRREFVLLQGTGCAWRKCSFCDYHTDVSDNPFLVNAKALNKITGEFGVADIINSGSCLELDEKTLALIGDIACERRLHTLWFEAHWMYHNKLADFAARFPHTAVKFRTGIETFDVNTRRSWSKGIPEHITVGDVACYFQGICLLVGVQGQSQASIDRDIKLALKHFEYFSVNVFVENTTKEKRDSALVEWFINSWKQRLDPLPSVEILLHNTDLGVG